MSDTSRPPAPDDSRRIILERLGPHRRVLEKLVEQDFGPLSDDAKKALAVLNQEEEVE